jgi:uncharacterized protein (DUF1501 family)
MNARWKRRELLRVCAGAAAALVAPAARPTDTPAAGADTVADAAAPAAPGQTLVFVRLRGGADGLSLIVPYKQDGYYDARPRIAIARPSDDGKPCTKAVALDENFGLHPALGWKALFDQKHMGAVVGIGPKTYLRSHRSAQQQLDALLLRAAGGSEPSRPTGSLQEQLRQVADSLAAPGARTVLVESTGWDTHLGHGHVTEGRFAALARELGAAVREFHIAAERHLDRVRLAIVTEFGRTLAESPSQGTDDGHAAVLFTLGSEQSGRVQGDYGRLERGCVFSDRARAPSLDLEVTLTRFVHGEAPLPFFEAQGSG